MYRIAVLSDHEETGQRFAEQVTRFCTEKGIFPAIELHHDQEKFFCHIGRAAPTSVIVALRGVAGLNAAEHLRQICPECGLIWCSDLDFSLHAFRLRAEYFMLLPVSEEMLREGLTVWFAQRNKAASYHYEEE